MVTYVGDIDRNSPDGNDPINQGDDRMRDVRGSLVETFPNVKGKVTVDHNDLNNCLQELSIDTGDNLVISNGNSVPTADIVGANAVVKNPGAGAIQQIVSGVLRIISDGSGSHCLELDGSSLENNEATMKVSSGSGGAGIGHQAEGDFRIAAFRGKEARGGDNNLIGHYLFSEGRLHGTLGFRAITDPPGYPLGHYIEFGWADIDNVWDSALAIEVATGDLHIKGDLQVSGDLQVNGALGVNGNINMTSGNIYTDGDILEHNGDPKYAPHT